MIKYIKYLCNPIYYITYSKSLSRLASLYGVNLEVPDSIPGYTIQSRCAFQPPAQLTQRVEMSIRIITMSEA